MTDYNLGTARGVIEIEYNGDGATQAQKGLTGIGDTAKKTGPTLDGVGRKAGIAGAVIAGGFALAAKSAADFEQRMSAVGAVSGANAAQMDQLRGKALQLGKDTQFSASEAASAIEELVKAGISIPDVMNGAADSVVNLAAAGEVSMPEAAAIAANAMNQFGIAAKDMGGVVDNIAGAANASAIDVSQFGQSLQQVGAVANLAGVDFEDTATAIALMGNAGIAGSDAGTSLKSMFQRLQPTTEKQTTLMQELGLVTKNGTNLFYDQQGRLKSLSQVAGLLQRSLKGMSAEQKQATLNTLFGSDAIRAAAIVSNAGSKGFEKMAASMHKVSAADVAAKRMDNFKGSLEQMKGSLETLGITIGTLLLPSLRSVVDGVTEAVNWFLNLDPAVQKGVAAFVGIAGAGLLALAAFVKIVKFLQAVRLAFVAVQAAAIPAWLAALGPIALVIVAIAAVVAILVLLWKKSETFRDIVTGVWDAVKSAAQAVAAWFAGPFVNFFTSAWSSIQSGLSAVKGFFVSVWNGIRAAVSAVFSAIGAVISAYIAVWSAVIRAGLAVVGAVWRAFWGTFGGVIKAAFALVVAIVRLGWTIVKGLFLVQLRVILGVTRAVWNGIVAVIRAVWGVIRAVVSAGANFVKGIVTRVWSAIRGVTAAVWGAIRGVISSVWGAIRSVAAAGASRVRGVVQAAWNAVRSITSSIWNGLKGIVSNAVNGVMGVVNSIKGRVTGALSGAASWLYHAGQEVIQGLLNGIESMIGAVTSKISKVTSFISSHLPGSPVKEGPLKVLNHGYAGRKIVEMVIDGIDDMKRPLQTTMDTVMTVPTIEADLGRLAAAANTPIAAPEGVSPSRGAGPGTMAPNGHSRIVEGRLFIDPSGRAYFKGLAEDVYDGNERFARTHGRQGGR